MNKAKDKYRTDCGRAFSLLKIVSSGVVWLAGGKVESPTQNAAESTKSNKGVELEPDIGLR